MAARHNDPHGDERYFLRPPASRVSGTMTVSGSGVIGGGAGAGVEGLSAIVKV